MRFSTFNAAIAAAVAGAGIALGRRPLIDFELASGRFGASVRGLRSLPGSWDMIIRAAVPAPRAMDTWRNLQHFLLQSLAPGIPQA